MDETTTTTHTVETRFGPTEIETVECASCGTEISQEAAVPFQMGDPVGASGYACEHCADVGPAGFPEQVVEWALPVDRQANGEYGLPFHVVLAPLTLVVSTAAGLRDGPEFDQGYATAVVTIAVWAAAFLGAWYLL